MDHAIHLYTLKVCCGDADVALNVCQINSILICNIIGQYLTLRN